MISMHVARFEITYSVLRRRPASQNSDLLVMVAYTIYDVCKNAYHDLV